jgi:PAS domain S-box-containing protein
MVFIALAVVVSMVGRAVFDRQSEDMKRESAAGLLAIHKVQTDQIARWFADERRDAGLLAADRGIARALERHVDAGSSRPVPRALRDELDLMRRSHDIASITVLDTGLRPVAASPARAATAAPRDRALAAEALRTGGTTFADAYRGRDGRVVMDLASPMLGGTQSPSAYAGVMVLRLRAEDVLFPLLEAWPPSSQSGESVLMSVRGDLVVSLNPLPVGGLGPLAVSRPVSSRELSMAQAARGGTGIVEGVDYRGEPVLAAIGRVPGTPWYLEAKEDLAAIDRPIHERALATLAWVVGIIVLAGVGILLYWRSREARSLRDLVGAERERRRAEARYAALMREAKEIVLLLRSDDTVAEANDYALDAYGYSRDELVGRGSDTYRVPLHDIAAADGHRQLDEHGGHLTYESVHRRRDGVEFPVEVSLSVVGIEGERYNLAIVRDIGERKAAEAALRDSEARYRTLFENALSGFALHEMLLGDDGEPVDYVFLAANPAFETQTGLVVTDIIGRRATDVIPGLLDTGLVERYGRVASSGAPDRFESFVPALGRHFDIQAVSPRPGQFATIFIDVTERREAEELISSFFGSSPVGLFVLDRDLRYVRVNETLASLNGVPVAGHAGHTVAEVVPRLAGLLEPALTHVLDAGEALHGLEMGGPAAGPEGTGGHALVSVFPILDPDGRVEFIGGVVVDVTEAQAARQAEAESRDFLERVLGVTPEVIYIYDIVEQRNVFSNREILDLLGYSPEEILAMGNEVLPRILHPDDGEVMKGHHLRARELADGEVLEVEYRMRRADGEWVVLHGRDAVFARAEDGEVTQLIGTAQDVTEQRRAEAELVRMTQRTEATVTASPLAVIALDTDLRVQLWNPAAAAVFGWTAEEVTGRPAPFIPRDAAERVSALQRRLAAGEQFSGLDLPWVRKDGARITTSTSLAQMSGPDDVSDSVLVIVEDVTELRAGALRLARLTRLYRVLSSVAETLPRVRDPQRLYEEVCRIVVEQGGFSMAWIGAARDGGRVQVLASAGDDDGYAESLDIDLRHPATTRGPTGIALLEGETASVSETAADARMGPIAGAAGRGFRSSTSVPILVGGRPEAALSLYSSETGGLDSEEIGLLERLAADVGFAIEAAGRERARRKAERELEKLNAGLERRVRERTDALEAANAELEAFSYSVSHDLRAPLRALDGFSLALLEDYGSRLDGDAADYLARIRSASQRMARLIDDLLMLSRVTRRGMTWERVDLSALTRSIAGELADDDPGRQVQVAIAPNMVVDGDAHLLDVAMRNLLGNAWKFTAHSEEPRIDVGMEDDGDDGVFFVRDNGAGFDVDYADKLFVPFQRLHGDDEFPGTGIGLATVQRIVRRHGGRVWAEGETGKGATVRFTLGPRGEDG